MAVQGEAWVGAWARRVRWLLLGLGVLSAGGIAVLVLAVFALVNGLGLVRGGPVAHAGLLRTAVLTVLALTAVTAWTWPGSRAVSGAAEPGWKDWRCWSGHPGSAGWCGPPGCCGPVMGSGGSTAGFAHGTGPAGSMRQTGLGPEGRTSTAARGQHGLGGQDRTVARSGTTR